MAGMTDLAIRIATTMDATGMNKAGKSVDSFDKKIKRLGKTLGVTLGAAAMAAYAKNAVKAFAADEKSAAMLTLAVKNLGLAFEQANIDQFIAGLEKSAAIADDVLRPAMQSLLTTTGSVTKSQQLLNLAIETSRGSGVDLQTVVQDLANAYVGQTRGLRKYNLGLSQTELKTMSFLEIQAKLAEQFSGANAAYLSTYAGQMEVLGVAAGNAAEIIGKSLVDALLGVSGAASASTLGQWIESTAGYIAGLVDSIAKLVYSLKWLMNPKNWLKSGDDMWAEWDKEAAKRQMAAAKAFDPTNNAITGYKKDEAARRSAEAAAKKRAADLVKVTAKNTAEIKKQNSLKKSGTVFDLEQIQLVAALKGKLTAEETMRVQAQLALLNGNEAVAKQLTDQILKAQDATGNLSKFLAALPNAKNPFEYLDAYLSYLAGKAAAIAVGTPFGQAPPSAGATAAVPNVPATNVPTMPSDNMISYNVLTGLNYNPNANNVIVELKITGEGDVTNAIAKGLQNQSLSTGDSSYINRRTGGFAG